MRTLLIQEHLELLVQDQSNEVHMLHRCVSIWSFQMEVVVAPGALAIVSKDIQLDMPHEMDAEEVLQTLVEETRSISLSLQKDHDDSC